MGGRFKDKTVVIAGGASGIGRACVDRFQAEGASVHVLDISGPNPVDVTDERAVNAFFEKLPVVPHVAVNAAGDANLQLILDQPASEFARIVNIELMGAYIFLQAAARRMVASGQSGAIVTISSEQEEIPSRGLSGHCAAKAGVAMLTKVAAIELGVHSVRVNAVGPGCTATPLTEFLRQIPGYVAEVRDSTPLGGRYGEPRELAAAVAFLASEDASWVTGVSLRVDGGQSLVYVPDVLNHLAGFDGPVSSKVLPASPSQA